ncbi:MAG: peptide chain release factor N(5)-glutamine methyltransferase, partial [Actinobacteria bacterium]|nr:peptide chain release factor N(5)-glutamine methyltransferase [Actinomycetota bacterium]
MLKERLRLARKELSESAISEVDAELIAAYVLGVGRMELHAKEFSFSPDQEREFTNLIAERKSGIPVQYLTGEAHFRYLTFDVGPGVLIPRPETELLVDAALVEIERIQSSATWRSGGRTSVVDLGAGSGAIAISIADEARKRSLAVQVVAVENQPEALIWLERNIAKHDVDVRVVKSDVATALEGIKCDLVVTNPPYIPDGSALPREVVAHEPVTALFGGIAGIEVPSKFIESATRILKAGGFLILEHHESQSEPLAALLAP